ncbi:DnaJ domain-containing protein [Streptomyces parvus]|uniref:DnaJ domain-containing protein n=1 Tax=Streptomyces parvus TaxID=66428 RepID=UPI00333349CC
MRCGKKLTTSNPRARYCSAACRQREYRQSNGLHSYMAGYEDERICQRASCGRRYVHRFARDLHTRMYCSDACKAGAYRDRKREEREAYRRWQEDQQRQQQQRERQQERERQEQRERQRRARSGSGGSRAGGGTKATTGTEARAVIYDAAGLVDDGTTSLRKAYRMAARRWHPDVNGSPEATRIFQQVEQAVALLRRMGETV